MKRAFLLLCAIIFMFCTACTSTTSPAARPSLQPAIQAEETTPANLFNQTGQIYIHKSGAFQLPSLEGWQVNETDNSVVFTDSDQNVSVSITVMNMGRDFDQQFLEYYAYGVENAVYGQAENYQFLNTETDADAHLLKIERSYSVGDKYYHAIAWFKQEGQAICSTELTVHSERWMDYSTAFPALFETITYDGEKAAELEPYETTVIYTAPEEIFTIEVPESWIISSSSPNADTIIDSINSPDGLAGIQIISFNNGYTWNQKWAGDTALSLLNNYYTEGAGDIKILADVPIEAGKRERLDWTSQKGGYSGSTYFETHGRQLVLFSLTYGDAYAEYYKPILEQIADSYQLKEE